jgi:hypothetical protein
VIQLHHFTLTRAQLESIPVAERSWIVALSHAANELSVLTKLFHYCSRQEGSDGLLAEPRNAQALVLGRLLTGKLYETWRLLQSAFFGSAVSRIYEPQFDETASDALNKLKRYFGRRNLIETVRNRFAFHYSADQVEEGFTRLVDGDPLDVYLSKTNANTLYTFAESIATRSFLQSIDPADPARAFDALIRETSEVVGWLNEVIAACMITCLSLHIGGDLRSLGAEIVNVEGAPDWRSGVSAVFCGDAR